MLILLNVYFTELYSSIHCILYTVQGCLMLVVKVPEAEAQLKYRGSEVLSPSSWSNQETCLSALLHTKIQLQCYTDRQERKKVFQPKNLNVCSRHNVICPWSALAAAVGPFMKVLYYFKLTFYVKIFRPKSDD